MIRLATCSEASGCEASPLAAKTRSVPLTRYHLLEDGKLLDVTGSRHTTQPAHAGVGGHHTTVSPLFFIAYPQTRVPAPSMLGPCAVAACAVPQSIIRLLTFKELPPVPKSTDPTQSRDPKFLGPEMSFSDTGAPFS